MATKAGLSLGMWRRAMSTAGTIAHPMSIAASAATDMITAAAMIAMVMAEITVMTGDADMGTGTGTGTGTDAMAIKRSGYADQQAAPKLASSLWLDPGVSIRADELLRTQGKTLGFFVVFLL